ncbi:MAG: alpha/beta hydrolase [Bacteroidales bacterium]|nr:alpha/beta hydrolase [Bacteroidales bacterium]
MKKLIMLGMIVFAIALSSCTNKNKEDMTQIKYKTIQVEDCKIFYRETGDPQKPTLLLLHGFPSSSHMFRELMPELAADYHLVAPDFPGFGQTESPDREEFDYTFDHLAKIIDRFTEQMGLTQYAMYVFDYGAPIGYRLAMWHPERITAIISQNGNMYDEGLGKKWEARKQYWKRPTDELRQQFASAYALETIIGQYTYGTPEGTVGPDGYLLDYYYVCLPGRAEVQNDLILDYRTNVALYPEFQRYLHDHQPPLLAVWGENDPSFIPAGAEAFRRDVPNAEIHFVPSGHFALESHHTEIAALMRDFLSRVL